MQMVPEPEILTQILHDLETADLIFNSAAKNWHQGPIL